MAAGECNEVWRRLQNVRQNGEELEYAGLGASIDDVGLAQTNELLSPDNPYFELKIVAPGEKCFIAIGLTSENYPPKSHLGWSLGSIAYHADNGNIFMGGGLYGEPFGQPCGRGDDMGCGIRNWKTSGQAMKFQVYFTRNGEEVGSRQVCWPTSELYPSIGMLSNGEKVRVDLRPERG